MFMKLQRVTALILVIMVIPLGGYAQAKPKPFSLTITTRQNSVQAEDLVVRIIITNKTPHQIRVGQGTPIWMYYKLEIRDGAEKEPPFTTAIKGLRISGGDGSYTYMPSFRSWVLEPGQSAEDFYRVADVYDLNPGTYTIHVRRIITKEDGGRDVASVKDLTPDDVVLSNQITVTVTK